MGGITWIAFLCIIFTLSSFLISRLLILTVSGWRLTVSRLGGDLQYLVWEDGLRFSPSNDTDGRSSTSTWQNRSSVRLTDVIYEVFIVL